MGLPDNDRRAPERPIVDVAQLVTRGPRLELTISEDGGPSELVNSYGQDRLMILGQLIARGFKLETTGADPIGPHTVDSLVRVRRRSPQ